MYMSTSCDLRGLFLLCVILCAIGTPGRYMPQGSPDTWKFLPQGSPATWKFLPRDSLDTREIYAAGQPGQPGDLYRGMAGFPGILPQGSPDCGIIYLPFSSGFCL